MNGHSDLTAETQFAEQELLVLHYCKINNLDPDETCGEWEDGCFISGRRRDLLLNEAISQLRWYEAIIGFRAARSLQK